MSLCRSASLGGECIVAAMEKPEGRQAPPRKQYTQKYRGPERRHSHRRRLACIMVSYRRGLLGQIIKSPRSELCPVSNINSHGVRFYAPRKLRRRCVLDMSFEPPAGVYRLTGDTHVKARVIWQKWSRHRQAWRTGAQFVRVSASTHADLVRMMDEASLHSKSF